MNWNASLNAQLSAALILATSALAQDPTAELAAFKVAPGFEVNLFASETNGVVKPIQCRWDARGRLWVIGSTVYPQLAPGQVPDDKIVILEDTDADGRADRTTIFASGLMIPTGIEVDGDARGCLLGEGTQLLHLRDHDGDGRADEKKVVLRGFGTGDNHQNINSFRWTHGGELVFCQGLHAHGRVETLFGIVTLDEAGFWRWRPREARLDSFYGGSADPQNPWGFSFDDWGQLLMNAGNNGGIFYPLPEMIRGHRLSARDNIWVNARGRKTSGPDTVANAHWPADWQGAVLFGGYLNNAVWALKLDDDGAGFRFTDRPPLITSPDASFRPIDVKFGPDGALYIADWCNPIIGHYQTSFRHPDRDKTRGRIWRVTAKGRPLVKPPQLLDVPLAAVLDQLKSTELWNRYHAKRVLADADTDAVMRAMKPWLAALDKADPRYEHHLFEALGVHEAHERAESTLLQSLLTAKEPRARAYAAGVAGRWAERLKEPYDLLLARILDSNPRVRLAAIVATANLPDARSMSIITRALEQPTDKFIDLALRQAVYALKPHWLPALTNGTLELALRPAQLEFLIKTDGTPDTIRALRALLDSPTVTGARRESFLERLADAGDVSDLNRLLDMKTFTTAAGYDAAAHARVLPALERAERLRKMRPAGDLAQALTTLLDQPNTAVRAEALRLTGLWKVTSLQPVVLKHIKATGGEDEVRLAAIAALTGWGGDEAKQTLLELAEFWQTSGVRLTAIRALASADLPAAAALGAAALKDARGAILVERLVMIFVQRTGGGAALAQALMATPPERNAARLALRHLQSVGHNEPALVAALSKSAGLGGEPLKLTAAQVGGLAQDVHVQGDAARGAAIFRRRELGCVSCHAIGGEGGNIGPALDSIGSGQPLDFIIGAVLEPNREVKESYEAIEVTTKDGETYQGYRLRADKTELVLRDTASNKEVRFRRDQIAEQRDLGSVMPAGLVDHLTRQELRDLFRYLATLGKAQP